MRRTLRLLSVVSAFAIYPAMLHAQGRGGGVGRGSVSAPHVAIHFPAPTFSSHTFGVSHMPTGSHWVRTSSGGLALHVPRRSLGAPLRSGPPTRRLLSQDAPGLGFDYAHFAAVHPGGRGFRDRDRDRFRHDRFVGVFFPFFGGGGYWPLFPEDIDEESSMDYQQPEAAEAEPSQPYPYPAYAYPPPRESRPPEQGPSDATQAAEPEAEQPTDQYVFVRRDGTVFFAVGYMWDNGTLRYITREGLRRSVAGSTLDLDATQQFNEQRGLTFHLPA
ncbi:MAG TPA: hypothetical protein VE077_08960 [Candidatus Methylomirabilis sp.]|nr:hypothetical protein [Candidatus Methylomirabilis sp.]